jgi:hypothetical protein
VQSAHHSVPAVAVFFLGASWLMICFVLWAFWLANCHFFAWHATCSSFKFSLWVDIFISVQIM